MWRVSECRVGFRHCGRSFLSPAIYKSLLAKRIAISGSMFRASNHFHSTSNDAFHLLLLPFWVHWYRSCIVFRVVPQHEQRLVVLCPCHCRIAMVGRVLLIHFVMKCAMCKVVVSCACLNDVRSILSQSDVWVRFRSSQCWSSWLSDILYAIEWAMLYWTGYPCIDTLGIPC